MLYVNSGYGGQGMAGNVLLAFSVRRVGRAYSSRNSIEGSVPSARSAGIQAASKPTSNIVSKTPARTIGSRGVAWYTISREHLAGRQAQSKPAAEPDASSRKVRPSAALNTSLRCAPRAMRQSEFPQALAYGVGGHAENRR